MNNWHTYVKHSYEVILEAESKLCVNLEHETEAYVVHLFARYMDKPNLNTEPVCTRLMQSVGLPNTKKKLQLISLADECLLIDGLELAKNRWPSNNYYKDMGMMAYDQVAYTDRPPDAFFMGLAKNFSIVSKILNKCRIEL